MKVEVTQQIIDEATAAGTYGPCDCALARAAQKAANNPGLRVGYLTISYRDDRRDLPPDARKFSFSFTYSRPVNPATFDLPIEDFVL